EQAQVPIPLGRALSVAEVIIDRVSSVPGVTTAHHAGALRRGSEFVGSVDLVVRADDSEDLFAEISEGEDIAHVSFRSPDRLIVTVNRTQIVCRCPAPDAAATTLLCATGSREHVAQLEELARARGLMLRPEGLFTSDGQRRAVDSETAVYGALGL